MLNRDPWEEGWMVKIRMEKPSELADLLDAAGYEEVVKAEGN